MTIKFTNLGTDFSAYHQLQHWCIDNNYACGSMQGDAQIGLMRGRNKHLVTKWKNLSREEIDQLDGVVTWENGGPRTGNCTVVLRVSQETRTP